VRSLRCWLAVAFYVVLPSCTSGSRAPSDVQAADLGADADKTIGPDSSFDGGTCNINVLNYDRSCTDLSDCIEGIEVDAGIVADTFPVQSGDYCIPFCLCGGAAISKAAAAQYAADIARTPLGSGALTRPVCGCIAPPPVCCYQNLCQTGENCPLPSTSAEGGEE